MPTKYTVSLSNPADLRASGPSSYGTGRYGHNVSANSMADARTQVIERARKDVYYGSDWSAKITRLNYLGHKQYKFADTETEIVVNLFAGPHNMFDLPALPGEYQKVEYPGESDNT